MCLAELFISCFNPRPREGGDVRKAIGAEPETVSIHAPVKGATKKGDEHVNLARRFQSTPP